MATHQESTKQDLTKPELLEALTAAIIKVGSVKGGCKKLGLTDSWVWRCAHTNPELQSAIWAARQVVSEMLYDQCNEIADNSSKESYCKDRLRIETRMRVAGHMIPKTYGNLIGGPQVNVGVQVGLVCDETQRARLIDLRARLAKPNGALPEPKPRPPGLGDTAPE